MRRRLRLLPLLLFALSPLTATGLAQEPLPAPTDSAAQIQSGLGSEAFGLSQSALPTVTLEEAVQLSLVQHESVRQAEAAVEQALAQAAQSRSQSRPQVSGNVNYLLPLHHRTASVAGEIPSFFSAASEGPTETLTVNQLLYDFQRTKSAIRAADSRTQAARFAFLEKQQQLELEVTQAYHQLLEMQELALVRTLATENQAVHVEEARKLHTLGLGRPVDISRAETAFIGASAEQTESHSRALLAHLTLATLMGIDPRTPFRVEEPEEPSPEIADLDDLVQQALEQRPDLKRSQALEQAQEFTVQNVLSGNRPRLSASLCYTAAQVLPLPESRNLSLMLNLEIPLFDGGLNRARVREAEAELATIQAQESLLRRQVVGEVASAHLKMQTCVQSFAYAEAEIVGAEESVRVAAARYRFGLGLLIEVLDAEQALVAARTKKVSARSQLRQAAAQLRWAVGSPVDKVKGDHP